VNRRARKPSRERDERGSTLIEVLVASVITSSAVIVLVTGMGTLFASSIQNRESTTAGVVARSYAEALVVAVTQTGAWCSPTYTVGFTAPAGYTVGAVYGACPATTATTPQFQTATITSTTPQGATETLRMVVRKT
jgi:Tfp pilus assembly protein PilV